MSTDLAAVLEAADQQLAELGATSVGPAETADQHGQFDNRPTWDNWSRR